ncbi:MAG: hypothetical protein LQ348_007294, partial [Seirophora lacunosa]
MDEDLPVWDRKVQKVPEWLNKKVLERFPHRTMALKKYEVLCAMHNQVSTRYPDPQVLTYPFHFTYLHIIHRVRRRSLLMKRLMDSPDVPPAAANRRTYALEAYPSASGWMHPRLSSQEIGGVAFSTPWNGSNGIGQFNAVGGMGQCSTVSGDGPGDSPSSYDEIPLPMNNVVYERLAEARMGMRVVTVTFQVLYVTGKVPPYPRKNLKELEEKLRHLFK